MTPSGGIAGGEPDIAATLRRQPSASGAAGPGRAGCRSGRLGAVASAAARARVAGEPPLRVTGTPVGDVLARVVQPVGELAAHRDLDPEQVAARPSTSVGDLVEGALEVGLG